MSALTHFATTGGTEAAPPNSSKNTTTKKKTKKLVVISGVTSGIGRALFREFAARPDGDFTVAGCGRRTDRLKELEVETATTGKTNGLVATVDVGDDAAVARWAADVIATHGAPPDIVIANAGISLKSTGVDAWAIPDEALSEMLRVNVRGVANMARHFLAPMVSRGTGMFVGISSGSGRSTGARKGAYSTTKFAVEAYVKCVAHGLKPPMLAIPLAPGTLRTELNPNAPGATADEWAVDAVPFLVDLLENGAELNGASLSVPGYYAPGYIKSWIIKDGQPLLAEAKGAARHLRKHPDNLSTFWAAAAKKKKKLLLGGGGLVTLAAAVAILLRRASSSS